MKIDKLRELARAAISQGSDWIPLKGPKKWRPPKGFPRGELLCENNDGRVVRRFDAEKLLKWCDDMLSKGAG